MNMERLLDFWRCWVISTRQGHISQVSTRALSELVTDKARQCIAMIGLGSNKNNPAYIKRVFVSC